MSASKNDSQELDRLIQEFREEFGISLDWLLVNLNHPINLGYTRDFIDVVNLSSGGGGPYGGTYRNPLVDTLFKPNSLFNENVKQIRAYKSSIRAYNLSIQNLSYTSFFGFLIGYKLRSNGLINSSNFTDIYFWLEQIYYLNKMQELGFQDVLNIYFSDLVERIIKGLDNFNELYPPVEVDNNYFKQLSAVKRPNENVKKFFSKTRKLIKSSLEQEYSYKSLGNLELMENNFLNLLAAFSAANENRVELITNDYVKAYKTYYKLIITDITTYKCQDELFQDDYIGYLICENCNGYYELNKGESPSKFKECSCGGNLKYIKTLNPDNTLNIKYLILNTAIITLLCLTTFYFLNLLYFILIVFFIFIMPSSITMIKNEVTKKGIAMGGSLAITLGFIISTTIMFLYQSLNPFEVFLTFGISIFFISILTANIFLIKKESN